MFQKSPTLFVRYISLIHMFIYLTKICWQLDQVRQGLCLPVWMPWVSPAVSSNSQNTAYAGQCHFTVNELFSFIGCSQSPALKERTVRDLGVDSRNHQLQSGKVLQGGKPTGLALYCCGSPGALGGEMCCWRGSPPGHCAYGLSGAHRLGGVPVYASWTSHGFFKHSKAEIFNFFLNLMAHLR